MLTKLRSLTQMLTTLALTSLLIVSLSTPANAQQVTPGEPTAVDSGTAVTAPALVMSVERGRTLLAKLDSLSAFSDSLKRQVALRDSLAERRQEKWQRCESRLAFVRDTLVPTERAVQDAQQRVIQALREAEPSVLEEALGYGSAFGVGALAGQAVCMAR